MCRVASFVLLALCALQLAAAYPRHLRSGDDDTGADTVAQALAQALQSKAQALQGLQDVTDALASGSADAASQAAAKAVQAGLEAANQASSASNIALSLAVDILNEANNDADAALSGAAQQVAYKVWDATESLIVQLDQVGDAIVWNQMGLGDDVAEMTDYSRKTSLKVKDESDQLFSSVTTSTVQKAGEVSSSAQGRVQTLKGQVDQARQAALDALDAAIQAAGKAGVDAQAASEARDQADQISKKSALLDTADTTAASLATLYSDAATESQTSAVNAVQISLDTTLENITAFVETQDVDDFVPILRRIQGYCQDGKAAISRSVAHAGGAAVEAIEAFTSAVRQLLL